MKMLLNTFPGIGHFFPVVPLAWAARSAGHDVLVVTTGPALQACGQAGLPAVDVAPGLDVLSHVRGLQAGAPPGLFRDASSDAARPAVARMMSRISDLMADRVVEAARAWRADLIVHTPIDASGPLAGAVLGVPTVLHELGLSDVGGRDLRRLIYEAMGPACQRHGVAAGPAWPSVTLDTCPPSMRAPGRSAAWSMRSVPYNGGGTLPGWLQEPPSRRRICVTLGSAVPRMFGIEGLGGVVEAVGDLDAEVVLALGDVDVSGLGTLPGNVRVAGWTPLSALLPTCAAIVHHGGAGTTTNALAAGLPQLVLPHGADQHANASAVERRGLGLMYRPEDAGATRVRESLGRLLGEPGFVRAAAEVRAEIATQPAPAAVVSGLVDLAAEHRPASV